MVAVYAIVNGNEVGWATVRTLGLLGIAGAILALFVWIESRVAAPLVPLSLFRLRNLAISNVVGILWAAAMFAWFFLSALYLQLVLGYSPLEVGLAFLPGNLIMAVFSLGLSAKLVMRYGIRKPLGVGLGLAALGLLLFARAPVDGTFAVDVLPSMILLGIGAGMAFNPVLLAAMGDVPQDEAGLASGVVNTAFMMGGALGLAVLASLAASRTSSLEETGSSELVALTGGYHVAFLVGAIFAGAAAAIGASSCGRLRPPSRRTGSRSRSPRPRELRRVLLVDRAHGVDLHADPDAGVERLEQVDGLLPVDQLRKLLDGDLGRAEVRRVALPRQHRHVSVGRDEVGEEAVALIDLVVVVRHGLAGLDDPVLGGGDVRGHTAREPGGVEAHSVRLPVGLQGRDVAIRAVTARRRGGRGVVRVVREIENAEDAGSQGCHGRNACQDDDGDLHELSRRSVRGSASAAREE
jgi:hypothetical protein